VSAGPAATELDPAAAAAALVGDTLDSASPQASAMSVAGSQAVAPSAAPAAASAPRPAPPATPAPLAQQVSAQLFALKSAGNGEHVLTMQVTPDTLGPVTVRAHVGGDTVRIELIAPTELGREALKAILPDLRRDLAQGGLPASLALSTSTTASSDPNAAGQQGARDTAANSATGDGATARDGFGRQQQGDRRSTQDPAFASSARSRHTDSLSVLDILA
jgi:flagellar hook-length control protein FliK